MLNPEIKRFLNKEIKNPFEISPVLSFTVPGKPMGQPRARVTTASGHVRHYDPWQSRQYKERIAVACRRGMRSCGAVPGKVSAPDGFRVLVKACFSRPTSWPKRKVEASEEGLVPHVVRPDADNVAKIVLDALNGIVWKDDSEVVWLMVCKSYAREDCLSVSVEW